MRDRLSDELALPAPPPGVDEEGCKQALRMMLELVDDLPDHRQADGFAALLRATQEIYDARRQGESVGTVAIVLQDDATARLVDGEEAAVIAEDLRRRRRREAMKAARTRHECLIAARHARRVRTRERRPRRRAGAQRAMGTRAGTDPGEDGEPSSPPRLTRHPTWGLCSANLIRVLARGGA